MLIARALLSDVWINDMILVVDDDEDVRATICQSLETLAYPYLEAESGRDALLKLKMVGADLAILDYVLPDMTGAELAVRLRAIDPGLPVIFATGLSDGSVSSAVEPGVPILYKPFSLAELASLTSAALTAKGG